MKNKLFYIFILSIILIVILHLLQDSKGGEVMLLDKSKTKGKTTETYKKGRDSVAANIAAVRDSAVLKPTGKDSSYSYTKSGSSYNLKIKIKPKADDKFSLKYFLKVKAKELFRVDTLFRMRVDTVKITKTIVKKVPQPFYNTFIFGAIITGSIILLLLHILN